MSYPVKWDATGRSCALLTGEFERIWSAKDLADKVREVMRNSEDCAECKCGFPIKAMGKNTFSRYGIIDGERKQDIEVFVSEGI